MKAELNISLTFNQVLGLVKGLPRSQKIKLSKELEKEVVESKLTDLLTVFKTDELSLESISQEVELVRQERYERSKNR